MLDGKRVAVVVPAHNEEALIGATLAGIPSFVDRVFVVDDASSDATAARVEEVSDLRVELIRHERNRGVGAAIVSGYKAARSACSRSSSGSWATPSRSARSCWSRCC
ncbi:MAG: glycosyltransferase [Gaiellaceae bacterium]